MGLSNSWLLTNFKAKKIGAIFKVKTPKKNTQKLTKKKHPKNTQKKINLLFVFCWVMSS